MKRFPIVSLAGCVLMSACGGVPPRLEFDRRAEAAPRAFVWSAPDEPYLVRLRTEYRLDAVVAASDTDYRKIQKTNAWTHGLWKHNGANEPLKNDPIEILREAKQGKRFRCVEYSVVLAGALNALGIKARILSLKTRDAETRKYGAGHVVVEAYLKDEGRWIMADGQFGVIPTLGGRPLSAVELQDALARNAPGLSVDGETDDAASWFKWVAEYLYYFSVRFDNRFDDPMPSAQALMLVPAGAKEPKVFQRRYPIENMTYTRSLSAFYPKL